MSKRNGLLLIGLLLLNACAHKANVAGTDPSAKEPPRAEARTIRSSLTGGLASLKDRKIGALVVFNLPDSYMIRAKAQINPPDIVLKELTEIQLDRTAWLSEALVTNCEGCGDVAAEPPIQVLPERLLLRLIDRGSLKQPPSEADWRDIAVAWPGFDVLWVILGDEDYEQKRGPSHEGGIVAAWSESRVTLRSFLRDVKSKKILHEAVVDGRDEDLILYQKVNEPESGQPVKAAVVPFEAENLSRWEPQGSIYDGTRYDNVYPYPPVPEIPLILRKSMLRLTETLAP